MAFLINGNGTWEFSKQKAVEESQFWAKTKPIWVKSCSKVYHVAGILSIEKNE